MCLISAGIQLNDDVIIRVINNSVITLSAELICEGFLRAVLVGEGAGLGHAPKTRGWEFMSL